MGDEGIRVIVGQHLIAAFLSWHKQWVCIPESVREQATVPLVLSQLSFRKPVLTVVQSHVPSSPQLLLVVAT